MKVPLSHRIIFDFSGLKAIYGTIGKDDFSLFIYYLVYINSNSLHHKKNHIVVSQKSLEQIKEHLLDKVDEEHHSWLSAALRPQSDPEIEVISDEAERTWEYAILVSSELPGQTIIFTDNVSKERYNDLKKKDKKENILIEDEGCAKARITDFYNYCRGVKASS